jgi:hypothetical protein
MFMPIERKKQKIMMNKKDELKVMDEIKELESIL